MQWRKISKRQRQLMAKIIWRKIKIISGKLEMANGENIGNRNIGENK
jgi:hypothetical protein